ncbi:subtilase family protein [Tetraselmis virus 1]|uniref:Subtilase family protein n=1 Tax=Tetraselmis virus 1 TaxID=2060617 RepID=A0A2P0VP02_9VIRU|nr:subtilase family protein [Tetraselmis virus 1]AUF82638.1 subtilase family protein [Tetraselmis virus 1]
MDSENEIFFELVDHTVKSVTKTLDNNAHWYVQQYRIPELRQKYGVTGKKIRVAVVDTGVCTTHPELQGIVARDCTGEGPEDIDGHGTHCCGIVRSVAPDAEIISIKVFDKNNRAVLRSLVKALNNIMNGVYGNIDVINMSLGSGEPNQEMRMILLKLSAKGKIIICAAGNEFDHTAKDAPRFGTVSWPAHFNSTLAVGSVNVNKNRSKFSSSGPKITIMAPGEDIPSTWINREYATLSGTSMASPFVCGCMALLLEKCLNEGLPSPDMSKLLWIIAVSSTDLEKKGFDYFTGYGLISPDKLIEEYIKLFN